MSSGFVSGGTDDAPRERGELWARAEAELEAERRRGAEQKNHDGKSLYEVLQANKAAKQEAFEESQKLRNQFRRLDEDDVDFLNRVRDAEAARRQTIDAETSERLALFHEQQRMVQQTTMTMTTTTTSLDQPEGSTEAVSLSSAAAATAAAAPPPDSDEAAWLVGKKRKRANDDRKTLQGIRAADSRKKTPAPPRQEGDFEASTNITTLPAGGSASPAAEEQAPTDNPETSVPMPQAAKKDSTDTKQGRATPKKDEAVVKPSVQLGLDGYSSDDDDD